jgi:quinoprotein glucose dehydrogenase
MARLVICLALIGAGAMVLAQPSPRQVEWPYFGGDQGGQRHSPLADIDATNVSRLQTAWQWKHWETRLADRGAAVHREGHFRLRSPDLRRYVLRLVAVVR